MATLKHELGAAGDALFLPSLLIAPSSRVATVVSVDEARLQHIETILKEIQENKITMEEYGLNEDAYVYHTPARAGDKSWALVLGGRLDKSLRTTAGETTSRAVTKVIRPLRKPRVFPVLVGLDGFQCMVLLDSTLLLHMDEESNVNTKRRIAVVSMWKAKKRKKKEKKDVGRNR
jgi:hypothetical protein